MVISFVQPCLYEASGKFISALHEWSHIVIFTANVWIMVRQTLLICLLTVFEQYHTTEGARREVAPLQSSLPRSDRICKPRLLEGAITSFRLERVWLFWIWHRPATLKLVAQILPFKYSVDFRCEALASSKQTWHGCVPQSESICLDRCTPRPTMRLKWRDI